MHSRRRIAREGAEREVVYSIDQWKILERKRKLAIKVLSEASRLGIVGGGVHGSVARGDVGDKSDIDLFFVRVVPISLIEVFRDSIDRVAGVREVELIQACPGKALKLYLYLDENISVSFPVTPLSKTEYEFYRFGGAVSLKELLEGRRAPGVNKKLLMIEPTPKGHVEYPIVGREGVIARKLGISVETVLERVRVLTRREEIGRTGVYIKLDVGESLAEAIRVALRRRKRIAL